jgi:hypothetical protein
VIAALFVQKKAAASRTPLAFRDELIRLAASVSLKESQV